MVKTAVILAAGMGKRLGNRTSDRPKSLLELDSIPIIEHSIRKLQNIGIEKIIMGVGYLGEMIAELARQFSGIECVYNPLYETSGSMQTLYVLKDYIEDDFILLESDLVYEKRALHQLIEHQHPDVILASELTSSGDEVFIEVTEKGTLKNMSKRREELRNVNAELIGITKLSYSTFQKICKYAENVLSKEMKMDYEQALTGISKDVDVTVLRLKNIAWCEVDDEGHWRRAVEVIYPIIRAREAISLPVKRNILLNPGPATTTDTVKYAQVVGDICPREHEFGEVMQFISTELTKFVASENEFTTVLFGGSGTAAVESIMSSVIEDQTVLIINNGAYGKRISEIAEVYQLKYMEYHSPFDQQLDLEKLECLIINGKNKISHLAIVHHETTTGLLNPIEQVGDICKKYGIVLIVDGMSSFAAIPIDMKKMNIGYLAASSNKNLQGMAGVSFVIANNKELEKTKNIKPRNLYLHLYSQFKYFAETKQMRFTPPVQTLYALKQAIIETNWEGIESRYVRYSKAWKVLIDGIAHLGLTHLVHTDHHSKLITAIIEPTSEKYQFSNMHDFFYEKGFTIYPGKFNGLNTFRIANIGDISARDMEEFISLLEKYLKAIT